MVSISKLYSEVITLFIIIPISATFEIKLLTASTIWLVLTRTYALLKNKVTDDVQAYFVRICPLISALAATSATNISVGASENWNLLAHWASGFQLGNKALSDFRNILRQPGLKYLPVTFTVYSGFSYCLKRASNYYWFCLDNDENKSKLY